MPNIATVLKEEIARIARKEMRKAVDPLRKQISAHRGDLAALKRERDQLKRQLAALSKSPRTQKSASVEEDSVGQGLRFSPARLRAQRQKLGISAEDFARLAGVSGQSVYNWEHGKSRPRAAQIERIAQLRGIGKREAQGRLAEAAPAAKKASRRGRRPARKG